MLLVVAGHVFSGAMTQLMFTFTCFVLFPERFSLHGKKGCRGLLQ